MADAQKTTQPLRNKEVTFANLVAAAQSLLDGGGPNAVTLRDVGRLAKVSHNAAYRHFADKEDLLAAVAEAELTRLAAMLSQAARRRSPVNALRKASQDYIDWARRHPHRFRLIFASRNREHPGLADAASGAQIAIVSLVAAAQVAGQLRPGSPLALAYVFIAALHGACDLHLNGHLSASGKGGADPEEIVELVLSAFAA